MTKSYLVFFFFSSRRRHTRLVSDWSSDVCSSDLDRLKSMKPRVAFQVPNSLTGEGNISVDITFESMDDFSPAAVRSEERRVGKEWRSRWSAEHEKKKERTCR